MKPSTQWGTFVLRVGLAVLFLWFGFSQFLDQAAWISWVPEWAMNMTGLEAEMIVLLNGGFEIAFGVLLALGLYMRPAAALLGLHLVVLVFEIGPNSVGLRDFAIMMASFALALMPPDPYSLDA
jgi:uncharacterized membrane protein YphA (DoxX/SURF4 family)